MPFNRFHSLNNRLLSRFGGTVRLSRLTPGVPDPSRPFDPVLPVETSEELQFIATAAAAEWVSQGVVLVGDLVGMLAVPVTLGAPRPGDRIVCDDRTYVILRAEPVHSDPNSVIHYSIQGRV